MGPGRLDSHTSPAGSGRHKTQLLVVASVGVLKHPARVSCIALFFLFEIIPLPSDPPPKSGESKA